MSTDEKKVTECVYLIWSFERGMWWRPRGHGYTRELSEAGHFSREEAEEYCLDANHDITPGEFSQLGEAMVPTYTNAQSTDKP